MSAGGNRAAAWIYQGIWGVLTKCFRVPAEPPSLPVKPGEFILSFQPDEGWLRYRKFWFWILLWPMDIAILIGWIAIFIALWWLALLLVIPALVLAVVPDIFVYIGIHLQYDTTWYVMTDRSLRIRRGIWVIHEVTITFENVQNVKLQQGPLQRHFGFSNLIVETAGAGGDSHGKGAQTITNRGMIEGVANAPELRDRILQRLRQSKSAGLGDEDATHESRTPLWTPEHLQTLRDIRAELRAFST